MRLSALKCIFISNPVSFADCSAISNGCLNELVIPNCGSPLYAVMGKAEQLDALYRAQLTQAKPFQYQEAA